jgi:glycosyltransferase involved in cell wall biosynthesis
MKTVSILISNRDSFEAIQLCIESIRKYTDSPCRIIVFDDRSINDVDLPYLRAARDRGWIELYENTTGRPLTHGGSLNRLVNEICDTDYAVVMDCDVAIKGRGWLREMIDVAEKDAKTLAVVDMNPKGYTWKGFKSPIYHFWFGLLNMAAYRDGMTVDWMNTVEDAGQEPYRSLFSDLADASQNDYFMSLVRQKKVVLESWDKTVVSNDCGAKLWLRVTYQNPQGYKVIPLPDSVRGKYRHFGHGSICGMTAHSDEQGYHAEMSRVKFEEIKNHLKDVRCLN